MHVRCKTLICKRCLRDSGTFDLLITASKVLSSFLVFNHC